MKWLKSAASYAFIAGFFYLFLAYGAAFGTRQSIVLALLLGILIWELDRVKQELEHAASKPVAKFSPYYALVWPKWQKLLSDFKLIGKAEEWDSIRQSLQAIPNTEHSVLRSGFRFTIVEQSEDLRQTLIYWNDRSAFASEVDFCATIEPVQIERRPPGVLGEFLKSDISLFLSEGRQGYNLGISVPDSWWKGVKETCPKPLSEKADRDCGQVGLVLATLPHVEFSEYWKPAQWREPTQWDGRRLSKVGQSLDLEAEREQCLSRFGWKKAAAEGSGSAWPGSIEHPYFIVQHNSI